MSTLNDLKCRALRQQGFQGSLDDMLISFYKERGVDGEYMWLANILNKTGSLNDLRYEYLILQGFTGSHNDMLLSSLSANQYFNTFTPISLFSAGEQGGWYDPSDFSTMFQDAAGTMPVTAVEQPVGLILDKSKGLVLGPELVTNGDFSNGTTGWALTGQGSWAVSSGVATINAASVGSTLRQTMASVVVGRWYAVSYDIVSVATTTLRMDVLGSGGNWFYYSPGASGRKTVYVIAQNANLDVSCFGNSVVSIDNISVRELPGNHAFQTTSTSRPVLSARYNLLTKTEQFDDAAWTKSNAAVASNASVAPDGALTADGIIGNSGATSNTGAYQSNSENAVKTISVYAKAGQKTWLRLFGSNLTFGAYFNLSTGAVGTLVGSPIGASISDAGDGWYRCSLTFNHTTGTTSQFVGFYFTNGDNTTASSGDGVTVLGSVWGASLVPANQAALPYQRVNTATDYDTTGFPLYLKFDGVDDFLVTNSVDFTATDKMTVFAGVRKVAVATTQMIVELSADLNTNNGSIYLLVSNVTDRGYAFSSKGTVSPTPAFYSPTTPSTETAVITAIGSISEDYIALRRNGVDATPSTSDQGTGNFGNYPLYIGRRAGTTLPFNGHLYSLIVRGAQSSAGQIASTETWVNGKTGAY